MSAPEITLPPEVVEAAAIALYISVYPAPDYFSWAETPEHTRRIYINHARAALTAALKTWPGIEKNEICRGVKNDKWHWEPRLILPLQETSNG